MYAKNIHTNANRIVSVQRNARLSVSFYFGQR